MVNSNDLNTIFANWITLNFTDKQMDNIDPKQFIEKIILDKNIDWTGYEEIYNTSVFEVVLFIKNFLHLVGIECDLTKLNLNSQITNEFGRLHNNEPTIHFNDLELTKDEMASIPNLQSLSVDNLTTYEYDSNNSNEIENDSNFYSVKIEWNDGVINYVCDYANVDENYCPDCFSYENISLGYTYESENAYKFTEDVANEVKKMLEVFYDGQFREIKIY